MREIWEAVVGYEGLYQVSNLGRIKRISPWADGRNYSFGMLRQSIRKNTSGRSYFQVSLCKDGKAKNFGSHQVVAAAFLGPCPPGKQVNHKSGNSTDNRPGNLEYVTPSENIRHAYRVLKTMNQVGSNNHHAKVSETDVHRIRSLHASGRTYRSIAARFGLHVVQIGRIVRKESWVHL